MKFYLIVGLCITSQFLYDYYRYAYNEHHQQQITRLASVGMSAGCINQVPDDIKFGKTMTRYISIKDPKLGSVQREYVLTLPKNYDHEKSYPLLLFLHGQTCSIPSYDLDKKGSKEGFIVVQPLGMSDNEHKMTAWNVGLYDHGKDVADKTCMKNYQEGSCYYSCQQIPGMCGRCNWSTCYDDGHFVSKLVDHLKNTLCINLQRVYGSGESNGGMMLYYLVDRFPRMFNAVQPIYASKLVGFDNLPQEVKDIDILHNHGDAD